MNTGHAYNFHKLKFFFMLTEVKFQKLVESIKGYNKRFLSGNIIELDESGTRIMINHFLTDVLGYAALEEVRTEYMIKGTYADYMIQVAGKRHFLVEVKAFSLTLNENHLRQAVNYGANEGVEWALLTNGKHIELYKIIFDKPIYHKKVFSLNLVSDSPKQIAETIQYLTKDCVVKKGLDILWNKALALTPETLSKILLSYDIVNEIRKEVNKQFGTKFENEQVQQTLIKIINDKIDTSNYKIPKLNPPAKKTTVSTINTTPNSSSENQIV